MEPREDTFLLFTPHPPTPAQIFQPVCLFKSFFFHSLSEDNCSFKMFHMEEVKDNIIAGAVIVD